MPACANILLRCECCVFAYYVMLLVCMIECVWHTMMSPPSAAVFQRCANLLVTCALTHSPPRARLPRLAKNAIPFLPLLGLLVQSLRKVIVSQSCHIVSYLCHVGLALGSPTTLCYSIILRALIGQLFLEPVEARYSRRFSCQSQVISRITSRGVLLLA